MKKQITEKLEIPEKVECSYNGEILICKKDSIELKRKIKIPRVNILIKNNEILFECQKANKNEKKIIYSYKAHIKNMFRGLNKKFVYKLEACNVHFPMSLKVEEDKLVISNFLGEKVPRYAKILPDVNVEIKGNVITVASHDKESAGRTASNFEKAGRIKARDRRVFQDGLFITQKPGEENEI